MLWNHVTLSAVSHLLLWTIRPSLTFSTPEKRREDVSQNYLWWQSVSSVGLFSQTGCLEWDMVLWFMNLKQSPLPPWKEGILAPRCLCYGSEHNCIFPTGLKVALAVPAFWLVVTVGLCGGSFALLLSETCHWLRTCSVLITVCSCNTRKTIWRL